MANISGTDKDIWNQSSTPLTTISPALGGKIAVNFGPAITEISMWNHTHPNRLFRKIVFWPLRGATSPNFYTC